jgi:hypothetical protein
MIHAVTPASVFTIARFSRGQCTVDLAAKPKDYTSDERQRAAFNSVANRQSSVDNRQSSIVNRQSSIVNPKAPLPLREGKGSGSDQGRVCLLSL